MPTTVYPAPTQPVSGAVTANAGTNLNTSALALDATLGTTNTAVGGLTETAPASDTASSGLNGRLQRIAQRLSSVIALLPAALVSGRLDVNLGAAPAAVTLAALPTGSNTIGAVTGPAAAALALDATLTGGSQRNGLVPVTSGGLLISRTLSVGNVTGTNPKASAGQLYGWYISNTNAAVRFVKIYNKATGPVVASDTPVITIAVPPGGAANVEYTNGIAFSAGIGLVITTLVGDTDNTAPAANEVICNLFYK